MRFAAAAQDAARPAGDYLVVEYQTEFASKPGTMETVTPMREPDGSWKVSGYFVK